VPFYQQFRMQTSQFQSTQFDIELNEEVETPGRISESELKSRISSIEHVIGIPNISDNL